MKSLILSLLNLISAPFAGKGIIHKYFPFLHKIYENLYSKLQPDTFEIVDISDSLKIKVHKKDTHMGYFLTQSRQGFEPLETSTFKNSLKPNSLVLDIGANYGYYTIIAARNAIEGTVYAFEPDRNNFVTLKENISLNNLKNVVALDSAVGDQNATVNFTSNTVHRGKSHIASNLEPGEYSVKVVNLSTFCAENGVTAVDLIKLDVEGYELKVLEGGREIIANSPNVKLFIEFNPDTLEEFGYKNDDFFATLSKIGLEPVLIIDEPKNKTYPFSQKALQNVLKYCRYTNFVCEKITAHEKL